MFALGVGGFFAYNAPAPAVAQELTPQQRAVLQAEYDQLQKEIAEWQKVLDETQAKKNTLKGDVSALTAQINKATAEIKQRNVVITQLSTQIAQKNKTVATLNARLTAGQESLAKILREKSERDSTPLVVLALSSGSLSDFFGTVDDLDTLNGALQEHFDDLRGIKKQTEEEKAALAKQQNAQLDARYQVQVKEKQITADKTEKNKLLAATTKQEQGYAQILAERQKRADEIRNALFDLRDAGGISFESALNYATVAGAKTGVRPAMILAILSQESDLGKNIGSCLVTNLETGNGVGKNTGSAFEKVMKAPRDTEPFQTVTAALGLNWASTPVSCPLGKVYSAGRGYGGGMGPSQFIPSTWVLFEPRLKVALGVGTPNPWNPQDAIMATSLYLKDLGAAAGTYTAERNAACKYYSGRSCDSRTPTNYTYGNAVVAKAETFQNNIDFLKDN